MTKTITLTHEIKDGVKRRKRRKDSDSADRIINL